MNSKIEDLLNDALKKKKNIQISEHDSDIKQDNKVLQSIPAMKAASTLDICKAERTTPLTNISQKFPSNTPPSTPPCPSSQPSTFTDLVTLFG
jgi:hypothetical protein